MSRPNSVNPPSPQPPASTGGSLALTTWGLFAGLAILLIGVGLFATLVGVRAELEGFGTITIGVIGAGYYAGFVAGSRATLRVVGTVGHIRVFTALASLLAGATLISGLAVTPIAWIVMRFAAGGLIAGVYVVAESWLNQLASNENRARILSTYGMVTIIAYGIGQVLLTVINPLALSGFALAAVAITIAVSPVALSAVANPPPVAPVTRIPLREMFAIAPTGVITAFTVGAVMGAVTAFAPVYAARSSMDVATIGVFTAMPAIGSLLLQVPLASLSDRVDRRVVGAAASLIASLSVLGLLIDGPNSPTGFFSMVILGGTMYPLYSIAGAYTNDRLPVGRITAAAAQLVVLFGIGAFLGPFVMAVVLTAVGDDGYPIASGVMLGAISLFLVVRIIQHPSRERATPERDVALDTAVLQVPATAVAMGRRLRPRRTRR
jgi:MFS family permease